MEIVGILEACLMFLGVMVLLVMLLLFATITVIVLVNACSKDHEECVDNETKDC